MTPEELEQAREEIGRIIPRDIPPHVEESLRAFLAFTQRRSASEALAALVDARLRSLLWDAFADEPDLRDRIYGRLVTRGLRMDA